MPAKALPPVARHVLAVAVIPILTFAAFMTARDGDRALREEYRGRRAAQKQALATLAVALGPGGCLAAGAAAMGVAVPLLVLRLGRREAIRAGLRAGRRERPGAGRVDRGHRRDRVPGRERSNARPSRVPRA